MIYMSVYMCWVIRGGVSMLKFYFPSIAILKFTIITLLLNLKIWLDVNMSFHVLPNLSSNTSVVGLVTVYCLQQGAYTAIGGSVTVLQAAGNGDYTVTFPLPCSA